MIRAEPCVACPYRRDVPSGVWSFADYAKLPPYDAPTGEQPPQVFMCHATPEHVCCGWASVGGAEGPYALLGLRLYALTSGEDDLELPEPSTPFWGSHTETAEHGLRDINAPSPAAERAMQRLLRKYERLRED